MFLVLSLNFNYKFLRKMKKLIFIILLVETVLSSCEKWIDPDINIDPNNPKEVAMAQLVAPIEANLA
jgi:hypothetical protein